MKKLIPVILCCAMLLAACGSSADSAPAASESTSAAASSEAASSAKASSRADGETDIVVSDEANTANLDAAVAAIEAVNPIANPRALDDFSVEMS